MLSKMGVFWLVWFWLVCDEINEPPRFQYE